jgi:O-antigen/teichoic acid export membrane protein
MLRGQNRLTEFNILELLQGVGRPILASLMVLSHMGIVGVAAGYVSAEAIVRFISNRLCPQHSSEGSFDRQLLNKMLRFGGATGIISLSTLLKLYSSSFIVGWKLDVNQVAVYQSTIALPLLLTRLAIIPFSNRLPSIIYDFRHNHVSQSLAASTRIHLLVILCSILALLIVCFVNKSFVTLWVGGELFAGFNFTVMFSLFLLMGIARHNGYMLWQARGRMKAMMLAHLIDLPVTVVLSIVFIDIMQLNGIACAFMLSTIPVTILSQLSFFQK